MYSYTIYIMAFLALGIVFSALLNTYFIVNAGKEYLKPGLVLQQAAFLVWMFGEVMQNVVPYPEWGYPYRYACMGGALLTIPAWILTGLHLSKRMAAGKTKALFLLAAVLGLASVAAYLSPSPAWVKSLTPLAAFTVFNGFIVTESKRLFPKRDSLEKHIDLADSTVLVFDAKGELADWVSSADESFAFIGDIHNIKEFIESVGSHIVSASGFDLAAIENMDDKPLYFEMKSEHKGRLGWYTVYCHAVSDGAGPRMGTVLAFYDITQQKLLELELSEKNSELEAKNRQLKDYLRLQAQLEAEQEKLRIARDIHGSLGRNIVELLTLLEAVKMSEGEEYSHKLDLSVKRCREIMGEISSSVKRLLPAQEEGGKFDGGVSV